MVLSAKSIVGGKYEIVRMLGAGGMGVVYEAVHQVTRKRVALKVMKDEYRDDEEASTRFVQEAMAVAHVQHPGVIEVYDASSDGELWIAMELLEGESLGDRIGRGTLSEGELQRVFEQLLDALSAVHRKNIVHRDLKPDNVFLVREGSAPTALRVKVLDFGIAKMAEGMARTRTRFAMGTPEYMAPEQFENAKGVDARSDLYSVGVMLYRCLSGRLPYEADSLLELARKVALEEPAKLVCPPALGRFRVATLACLQKDPRARPDSASAVRALLRAEETAGSGLLDKLKGLKSLFVVATPDVPGSAVEARGAVRESPSHAALDTLRELKSLFVVPAPELVAVPSQQALGPGQRRARWAALGALGLVLTSGVAGLLAQRESGAKSASEAEAGHGDPKSADARASVRVSDRVVGVVEAPRQLAREPKTGSFSAAREAHYWQACRTDMRACVDLADAYESSDQNLSLLMGLRIPACQSGLLKACVHAGTDYLKALDVSRGSPDYLVAVDARRRYRAACEDGPLIGCTEALANDVDGLIDLLVRACERADMDACLQAGAAYEMSGSSHARGSGRDETHALRLYVRACEAKSADGCYHVGRLTQDGRQAMAFFRRACLGGNRLACISLSNAPLENGTKDDARATQLRERAEAEAYCQIGDLTECVRLGTMARDGFGGLDRDDARAAQLYDKACERGNMEGCLQLGYMHEWGKGVARDVERAAAQYRKACAAQVVDACRRVRS